MNMNKHLFKAMTLMVLWTMSVSIKAEVAPPPPKPECHDIVYRKWNDVLFVDNGNEEYVSYQWYKNHTEITGETRQYLYTHGIPMEGDGNIYHVVATRANGSQVISCEGRFEDFETSVTLNPGKKIKKAVLYTYTGFKIGEWNDIPEYPVVDKGCYIWVVMYENGDILSQRTMY